MSFLLRRPRNLLSPQALIRIVPTLLIGSYAICLNPSANMFFAAFISLSCFVPQTGHTPGQPHKKYPSWNKNSLMDIFKWFLQFSEKSIPAHTLNDRYTAYSFFYKSFSSFYQIVYPISLGYNKSF